MKEREKLKSKKSLADLRSNTKNLIKKFEDLRGYL